MKPFKMLSGVLHLWIGDEVKVLGPGDVVKEAGHLAALGAERIEALVQEGVASYDLKAGILTPPLSEQEKAEAESVIQESRAMNRGTRMLSEAQAGRAQADGSALPERSLGDIMIPPSQPSRGVGGTGPISAGTTA